MAQDYLKKLGFKMNEDVNKQLVFCKSSCIEIMITCHFLVWMSLENK